jgi:tetratricopeptide (TPR) repeat protein
MIPKAKFLRSRSLCLAACCALVLALSGCARLQSRDELNKGVKAYKNQKFPDAIKHFQEAVRLDPASKNARLYLAVSYMIQWVPGADSPDNKKNHDAAVSTFNDILKEDPTNPLALAYMANMAYQQAATGTDAEKRVAFDEAKKWNQRRVEANPKTADAYYYLGVIDYLEAFPDLRAARGDEKLKADDPGPLKNAKVKADLSAKYGTLIQEGMDNLNKALQYDPKNEDAMVYVNLLLREKADLEPTPDAAKADVNQAENWSNKASDVRKWKAAQPVKKQEQT